MSLQNPVTESIPTIVDAAAIQFCAAAYDAGGTIPLAINPTVPYTNGPHP